MLVQGDRRLLPVRTPDKVKQLDLHRHLSRSLLAAARPALRALSSPVCSALGSCQREETLLHLLDVNTRDTEVGFGVLTEIDLKATLKEKLDVDIEPQVILGACRPQLAYRALEVEPSIAALLPCNVVVRGLDESTTLVEAFDPDLMMSFVGDDAAGDVLRGVVADARQRLTAAFAALTSERRA